MMDSLVTDTVKLGRQGRKPTCLAVAIFVDILSLLFVLLRQPKQGLILIIVLKRDPDLSWKQKSWKLTV